METPDYLLSRVEETTLFENLAAYRRSLWVVVLGLTPVKDGDQWSFLWGSNIQEGVCGFGSSPESAANAFEVAMGEELPKAKIENGGGKVWR